MVIRSFDGTSPQVHETAYVDEEAVVIGDVAVEAEASVWPNVTLRGDSGHVRISEGANVQDGAVCHERAVLGRRATIGHTGILHAATVEAEAVVGMGAVVLDGSHVGERAMVAAGSVVTEGTDIPPDSLAAGTPAEVVREDTDAPWAGTGDHYVDLSRRYLSDRDD